MSTGGTPRRTLLRRGLALLAGGVAVATGSRLTRAAGATPKPEIPADPKPPGTTFRLYTRQRPLAPPPDARHAGHAADARQLASGALFDAPDGRRIGTVYTNSFNAGGSLAMQRSGSNLEFQVMQLEDGVLFGMRGGTMDGGASAHAVIGGTGRYAGAHGVYIERLATGASDRDVVELVVTLAG